MSNRLLMLMWKNKCFITVEGGLHGKFQKDKNSEVNKAIADFHISLGIIK